MSPHEHALLQTLWDYLKLDQPLEKADVILVLGSLQTQPAEWAAKLYNDGWAPLVIMSGGYGHITKGMIDKPEAEIFADIAMNRGVPQSAILIEQSSSNTGENILFSRKLMQEKGIEPQKVLLVHKKYDERRTLATFQKQWPEMSATITSPPITLDEWLVQPLKARDHGSVLVGIVDRIMHYPEQGYMVEQEIPINVHRAFQELIKLGYTGGLIK